MKNNGPGWVIVSQKVKMAVYGNAIFEAALTSGSFMLKARVSQVVLYTIKVNDGTNESSILLLLSHEFNKLKGSSQKQYNYTISALH